MTFHHVSLKAQVRLAAHKQTVTDYLVVVAFGVARTAQVAEVPLSAVDVGQSVHFEVLHQVAFLREHFASLRACKWFHSEVDAGVVEQVPRSGELFVAVHVSAGVNRNVVAVLAVLASLNCVVEVFEQLEIVVAFRHFFMTCVSSVVYIEINICCLAFNETMW